MRIVGGLYRGREISAKGFSGRPTMDRAREALLNSIAHRYPLDSYSVLDLFAGTGAMGIEFASWGAVHVTCVESNARHTALLRMNARHLGVPNITVLQRDCFAALRLPGDYQLIFADPPYHLQGIAKLPGTILNSPAAEKALLVVVEHETGQQFDGVAPTEVKIYGGTAFSFFTQDGVTA